MQARSNHDSHSNPLPRSGRYDTPVHSFTSLITELATICANYIQPTDDLPAFTKTTTPTPLQRRAFELLAVSHRLGYT